MTRVKFLHHEAVRTKSDHKTLVADVRLNRTHRGKKQVAHLRLVSQNAGGRFDRRDLERLLKVYGGDVWAFQEASDQPWIADVMAAHGFTKLEGDGTPQVGQAATPTYVSERIKIRRIGHWIKLIGGEPIGKGAGPDRSKPKWWLLSWLAVDGIPFSASSWHATASQQYDQRFEAAKGEAREWIDVAGDTRRPCFTIGDTNSSLEQRLSVWILGHGMTSNHEELGELDTLRHRSTDAIYCQRRLVKP